MRIEIVSPEKIIYKGQVQLVTLPGELGAFSILEKHAPLITTLAKGSVICKSMTSEILEFKISGGFAEVSNNMVNVCVENLL